MRVFVLCTGRCGSTTFAKACSHITNYTVAHESNMTTLGKERIIYPDNHIEIDNRLSWFLGRLQKTYGDEAFYLHLRRDPKATARSYANRLWLGYLMHAYARGIYVGLEDDLDNLKVATDLCETITANIELFLKDKSKRMELWIEQASEQFTTFWRAIAAEGNLQAALAEWGQHYNATGNERTFQQILLSPDDEQAG